VSLLSRGRSRIRRPGPAELETATLVRYLLGEMTRSESEETERAVADSRRAQERVAELRAMIDELRRPPDWVESIDLVRDVNQHMARDGVEARALGGARGPGWTRARRWALGGGAGAALAATAALVLYLRGARPQPEVAGEGEAVPDQAEQGEAVPSGAVAPEARPGARAPRVRPKGALPAADPDRWVGVELARARAGGAAEAVAPGSRLAPGELMVTYTNLGPDPFSYLMVFAVDAAGEVRWLYPAYQSAGTDPTAIPIAVGAAGVALPDLIEHEFAAGRLAVCGLFLRAPLAVSQVEAALAGGQPAPGERLPFSGSGQHCFDLEVP
jgi:hypothetical protein